MTAPAHGGMERLAQVISELGSSGIEIDDIGLRRPTLDDVFLSLTGSAAESLDEDDDEEPLTIEGAARA
jgi:ABC-2 type transport system ATP-binding protein